MIYLYDLLIYEPLINALVALYNTIAFRDLGIAIILLTIIIRLILYPLFSRSARHQAVIQKLQPRLKEIQATHKSDLQRQSEATMALYREHRVNPFTGFLLLLVQLPILIALYQVFQATLGTDIGRSLYSFIASPGALHTSLLGLIDLAKPSIVIVIPTALLQYVQSWLMVPKAADPNDAGARMARTMAYVGPAITLIFFFYLPAAVTLYWFVSTAFSVLQQMAINKQIERDHGTSEFRTTTRSAHGVSGRKGDR